MNALWYPYTPMSKHGPVRPPLKIVSAKASRLFDQQGRSYLDANGSWWVSNLGHQHPRLINALKKQADRFCHVSLAGLTHEPALALAEALVAIAPKGLSRVFYSDDGSTALELAARIALQYHQQQGAGQRCRFIAIEYAFHGETIAPASFSDMPAFHQNMSSLLFQCLRMPSPADGEDAAIEALEQLLQAQGDVCAALVLEPLVQGAGGMRMHQPSFIRRLKILLDRYGVLLIADEVFVGYGRTGTMWAIDQAGLCPDILCTAKGFTGGLLPMAATLVRESIFEAFVADAEHPQRSLHYGHSYCGNPLACAVALEVLQVYKDEAVLEGIEARSLVLQEGMQRLVSLDGLSQPRCCGLIAAVDLAPLAKAGYHDPIGWQVYDEALRRGAYLRPLGNVLYMVPALNIVWDDLHALLDIAYASIKAVQER